MSTMTKGEVLLTVLVLLPMLGAVTMLPEMLGPALRALWQKWRGDR